MEQLTREGGETRGDAHAARNYTPGHNAIRLQARRNSEGEKTAVSESRDTATGTHRSKIG